MRSAARALFLAAAVLLCAAPAARANKEACPLELIFPAEQLVIQGQPKAVTLKVINPSGQTLNIASLTYTVPNGAPIPGGGGATYPGVEVTGAAKSSPGVPAPNPVGPKTVTYGAFSVGAKQTLKLAVNFVSKEGAARATNVAGTATYTVGSTTCTAIINVAATSRMAISTRITPKATSTVAGYQEYTNVYGLCPKEFEQVLPSSVADCATKCNGLGRGCTAFTFNANNLACRTYKASGNQGPQRLTYRYNASGTIADAFRTIGTTIFVKGSRARALYGSTCPFVAA